MRIIKLVYKVINGKETFEGMISYYGEKMYFKVINKRIVLYSEDGHIIQRPDIIEAFKHNKVA